MKHVSGSFHKSQLFSRSALSERTPAPKEGVASRMAAFLALVITWSISYSGGPRQATVMKFL